MANENLDQRLARIEAALSTLATKADLEALATKGDLARLHQQLARQLAAIQATHSDVRVLTGIAQSTFTALQALIGGYTDLSSRITDLENPADEG